MNITLMYIMCKILYIPIQIQIIKDETPGPPKAHNEVSLHLNSVARNGILWPSLSRPSLSIPYPIF